jgi:hypothetical protein
MTKRFERKERKGIHFTKRDSETVQAVYRARYLTNRHIMWLLYSETTYSLCKQRVRYLFDKGYLAKRRTHQNARDVYFLGVKGRHYIEKALELPREYVAKVSGVGGRGDNPNLHLAHDLELSGIFVDLTIECRQHGWELYWENARQLELRRLGVQPDAYFRVGERKAFIEYTAVMPSREEMERKLSGYESLLESLGGAFVLWLTDSRSKLTQLKTWLRHFLYKDYVLLGLIGDKPRLTGKVWQWSEREGKVAFMPAPEGAGGRTGSGASQRRA